MKKIEEFSMKNILPVLLMGSMLLVGSSCNNSGNAPAEKTEPVPTEETVAAPGVKSEPITYDARRDRSTVCPDVHWTYGIGPKDNGPNGPNNWQNLCTPYYEHCGDSEHQSPVNLWGIHNNLKLEPISQEYKSTGTYIENNGHTLNFEYDEGSNLVYGGKTYVLKSFHTHTPSEHTIKDKSYDMEMHFVHESSDGALAVVAVFVEGGTTRNATLARFVNHLPTQVNSTYINNDETFSALSLMPANKSYYTYPGSLTTPPCSPDVTWIVLTNPINAIMSQIQAFSEIEGKNNRPIQKAKGQDIRLHKDKG